MERRAGTVSQCGIGRVEAVVLEDLEDVQPGRDIGQEWTATEMATFATYYQRGYSVRQLMEAWEGAGFQPRTYDAMRSKIKSMHLQRER